MSILLCSNDPVGIDNDGLCTADGARAGVAWYELPIEFALARLFGLKPGVAGV